MVKMIFQEPCLRLKRSGCQRNSGSTDRVSLAKLAMDSLMYSGALTMMVMKTSATLMTLKLTMMSHHPLTHYPVMVMNTAATLMKLEYSIGNDDLPPTTQADHWSRWGGLLQVSTQQFILLIIQWNICRSVPHTKHLDLDPSTPLQ